MTERFAGTGGGGGFFAREGGGGGGPGFRPVSGVASEPWDVAGEVACSPYPRSELLEYDPESSPNMSCSSTLRRFDLAVRIIKESLGMRDMPGLVTGEISRLGCGESWNVVALA
jgi:hypothetical protein